MNDIGFNSVISTNDYDGGMNILEIDLKDLEHGKLLILMFNEMVIKKELLRQGIDMTKDIPATDILVPLQYDDTELTPYPEAEYMIIEATTIDKVVRDVNTQLSNGWETEGGIQVVSIGNGTRYYQSMIRRNVDGNRGAEPEMPSQNSEDGTMGPKPLYIPGLENEEDLYEDIEEDATNGETNG